VARRRRRRKATTRPGRGRWAAPDLVRREFGADSINQKWFGDGTEILTDEGKLFLDSVLDVGSRRVMGFALSEHHDTDCAYGALAMAVAVRGGRDAVAGVIFHTDQGSEYTAHRFRAACERIGIRQSMGRPGSALDNAVIESWHSTLEFELRQLEHYPTKAAARAGVAAFIDEYNRSRRHSALQMMSPIDFELGPQAGPVFRPLRMVPSSPGSRPSPAGGLRPALTPAPGGTERQQSKRRARMNKIKSH
jgi:putative transposase